MKVTLTPARLIIPIGTTLPLILSWQFYRLVVHQLTLSDLAEFAVSIATFYLAINSFSIGLTQLVEHGRLCNLKAIARSRMVWLTFGASVTVTIAIMVTSGSEDHAMWLSQFILTPVLVVLATIHRAAIAILNTLGKVTLTASLVIAESITRLMLLGIFLFFEFNLNVVSALSIICVSFSIITLTSSFLAYEYFRTTELIESDTVSLVLFFAGGLSSFILWLSISMPILILKYLGYNEMAGALFSIIQIGLMPVYSLFTSLNQFITPYFFARSSKQIIESIFSSKIPKNIKPDFLLFASSVILCCLVFLTVFFVDPYFLFKIFGTQNLVGFQLSVGIILMSGCFFAMNNFVRLSLLKQSRSRDLIATSLISLSFAMIPCAIMEPSLVTVALSFFSFQFGYAVIGLILRQCGWFK